MKQQTFENATQELPQLGAPAQADEDASSSSQPSSSSSPSAGDDGATDGDEAFEDEFDLSDIMAEEVEVTTKEEALRKVGGVTGEGVCWGGGWMGVGCCVP